MRSTSQIVSASNAPTAVPISTPFIASPARIPPAKPAMMQTVRKQPPAIVVRLAIGPPWQTDRRGSRVMVNAALTTLVGSRERPVR